MSRKGLYIALFASLALNLFILGLVVGAVVIGHRGPHPRMMMVMHGPGQVAAALRVLPPEERRAFREAVPDTLRASAGQLRQAADLRRSAVQQLSAERMDTRAVLADLARARAIETAAREAIDERVVTFVATLPPVQREAVARALLAPRRGRPGLGGGGPLGGLPPPALKGPPGLPER